MKNKLSLVIDTTQNTCYLMLFFEPNTLIDFVAQPTNNNMTDIVVEMIDQLFIKNKCDKQDLKNIYLVNGPGSFTGCRVGYIIARTLVDILNCDLYVIDSLTFQIKHGQGISLINAHGNNDFCAIYENNKLLVEPCMMKREQVNELTSQFLNLDTYRDYENIDFSQQFFDNKKRFKKVLKIDELKPFYIKSPINKNENH